VTREREKGCVRKASVSRVSFLFGGGTKLGPPLAMSDYQMAYIMCTDPAWEGSMLSWLDASLLARLLPKGGEDCLSMGGTCRLLSSRWWRYKAEARSKRMWRVHKCLSGMKRERERSARRVVEEGEENSHLLSLSVPILSSRGEVVFGEWSNPDHFFFFLALRAEGRLFHSTSHFEEGPCGNPAPLGASPRGKMWDSQRGGWRPADGDYLPYCKARGFVKNIPTLLEALDKDTGVFVPYYPGMAASEVLHIFSHVHGVDVEGMMRKGTLPHVSAMPRAAFTGFQNAL
jgi:hypothetical protein